MTLFLLLVAVAVIGVVAAVAAGRVRGGLDEPTSNLPYRPLPDGPVGSHDVDAVRFSLGLRGYRMDEVDTVLRRLGTALAERDDEIATLRAALRGRTRDESTTHDADPGTGADPDGTEQDGSDSQRDVDTAAGGPGTRTA